MLLCIAVMGGCDHVIHPKPDIAQAWHVAQMAAMAQQWQAGMPEFQPAKEPPRPWGVGDKVQDQYPALYSAARAEEVEWDELRAAAVAEANYCRALLAALHTRDSLQIGERSAELGARRIAFGERVSTWHAAHATTAEVAGGLTSLWHGRCLTGEFPLLLERLDLGITAPVSQDLVAQLELWHSQTYKRLGMAYLGMPAEPALPALVEASNKPQGAGPGAPRLPSKSDPPMGTEALGDAVSQLEDALTARKLFEAVASRDAELAQLFQPQPGGGSSFDTAAARRYREQRLPVARARLALLSHVDALLSASEDVLQSAATREWQRAWPGCPLETNVFAYAGLPERDS